MSLVYWSALVTIYTIDTGKLRRPHKTPTGTLSMHTVKLSKSSPACFLNVWANLMSYAAACHITGTMDQDFKQSLTCAMWIVYASIFPSTAAHASSTVIGQYHVRHCYTVFHEHCGIAGQLLYTICITTAIENTYTIDRGLHPWFVRPHLTKQLFGTGLVVYR